MKVCFISLSSYGYFNPEADIIPGGAQRQLFLLSEELKSAHEISFIVGDYGQAAYEEVDGISLYSAYTPDPDTTPLGRIRQLSKLYRTMRRINPDIFVYRGYPKKASIVYTLTRLLGTPFVYNIANDADLTTRPKNLNSVYSVLFRSALSSAEGIITQTKRQNMILHDDFTTLSTTVPNGYPPAGTESSYKNRDYFLWVGSIDETQKRPHLYLDLSERLPNRKFILIGTGETSAYTKKIQRRADSLTNVVNLGYVDPDEVHEYYKSSIAVINTSAYEGFPNVFLEAWRHGTPVLGYSVDPGRFLDSECLGFAEGDLERLSELASQVADNTNEWWKLSQASRQYFEENYSISVVADMYESVLYDAIESRKY